MTGQFAVAMHVMTMLALWNRTISSAEIAGSVRTNPAIIRKLIIKLKNAGLVEAARGGNGGYRLGRDSQNITIQDVFQAVGESLFVPAPKPPNKKCPIGAHMVDVLDGIYLGADQVIEKQFKAQSLADLATQIREKEDVQAEAGT